MNPRIHVFKVLVSSLALLTLGPSGAQAAPECFAREVLADAPIAYWRLGEPPGSATAVDRTGNGNNGTYSAAGVTLGAPGLFGGDTAAAFDGTGPGRVVVPNNAMLNPRHVTIEGLVSWAGPNGFQQRILEKSFFIGGEQAEYSLSILDDGRLRFEIRAGGGPSSLTSLFVVPANAPLLVAADYDGALMRIFVNGVLDIAEAPSFPGDIQASDQNHLGIGNQVERDRAFNGVIDEVALYGEALAAERHLAHYKALFGCPLALDHFKCYAAFPQTRFQPFNVTLTDQFENEEVRVLRPVALCNPVVKCVPGKDCTEISNPDDHLTCYALARSSNRFSRAEVVVSNQFGEQQPLTVLDRDILCVPSTKKVVVPPR
jgi:hypothetical protein